MIYRTVVELAWAPQRKLPQGQHLSRVSSCARATKMLRQTFPFIFSQEKAPILAAETAHLRRRAPEDLIGDPHHLPRPGRINDRANGTNEQNEIRHDGVKPYSAGEPLQFLWPILPEFVPRILSFVLFAR